MKIEITNGYAEIKDVYTRGVAKKVQEILMQDVEVESDKNGETKAKGFSMTSTERASDYAVCQMVEKLVINDKSLEIKTESFDELSNNDFKKIKEAIDRIASPEIPKE